MAKLIFSCVLILALLMTSGCIYKTPETHEVEEEHEAKLPPPINASQIYESFETEYENVKTAIKLGDLEGAKNHSVSLMDVYNKAKEIVGPEHLAYFVSEEKLNSLKLQLNIGDLASAKATVSEIGGKCGFEFCHKRAGSSMVNMEIEYTIIKKAINEKNLSRARSHFPAFKQFFNETREKVSTFMPEEAQTRMKKEYIDNLEIALEQDDVEGAKLAIETISNTTCSFAGCHKIFFTNRTLWKFY